MDPDGTREEFPRALTQLALSFIPSPIVNTRTSTWKQMKMEPFLYIPTYIGNRMQPAGIVGRAATMGPFYGH